MDRDQVALPVAADHQTFSMHLMVSIHLTQKSVIVTFFGKKTKKNQHLNRLNGTVVMLSTGIIF